MVDPYIEKFAEALINYVFGYHHVFGKVDFKKEWEKNKKGLLIRYEQPAQELVQIISDKIFDLGGNVHLDFRPSSFEKYLYTKAPDSVFYELAKHDSFRSRYTVAKLIIRSQSDTRPFTGTEPKEKLRKIMMEREARAKIRNNSNRIRRCSTYFPTEAYAKDAGLTLQKFKQYLWNAMYLYDDPIKTWQEIDKKQREFRSKYLNRPEGKNKPDTIKIVDESDETNLTMKVLLPDWRTSGRQNFPDYELANAPIKTSVNGTLTIPKIPQCYRGAEEVRGIWLRFENGKVIEYDAEQGKDFLGEFLQIPGANYLGEIALGMHPLLDIVTKQIGLDEKMGGTIHGALGYSNALDDPHVDTSQLNRSIVHWDLIRDMRKPTAFLLIDNRYKLTWDNNTRQWIAKNLN